jgi:signal peptidase I
MTTQTQAFHKSTIREYFESIVVAVILALFIRTFVVQAFKIPTGSMEPNLLVGDHLLVNKFVFAPTATALERTLLPMRAIRRGDVVVFKYPQEPDRDFIKRVIGLPGETVELKERRVLINGAPIEDSYAHYLFPVMAGDETSGSDVRQRFGPVTVPEGHYFMMGDNRDNSEDSRYWGFMPQSYVKGRALMIYWSFGGSDRASAGGSGLSSLFSIFTDTRWGRIFHQIH